jgi:hypothetical protein
MYEVWKLATLATLLIANNLSWKNWQQNQLQSGNKVATTGNHRPRFLRQNEQNEQNLSNRKEHKDRERAYRPVGDDVRRLTF